MNDLKIRIASDDDRLKRHINHDARSAFFRKDVSGLAVADVEWTCHLLNVLDQGDVGSCTAETADEILASDPYFTTLDDATRMAVSEGTQDWPLAFYHDETLADTYPGTYPPVDTGSDGLTMAKVLTARGLISGYQHTFTADDALKGLATGPAAWGTNWKSGMDDVDTTTGQVKYTGATRGGHELSLYKIEAAAGKLWFRNHWGSWGYRGTGVAWISFDDFAKSLKDQGDVTWLTPLTQPAPVPTPPPTPVPVPTPPTPPGPGINDVVALAAGTAKWRASVLYSGTSQARKAVNTFLSKYPVR